jgi:short-subunit dehydrogenase
VLAAELAQQNAHIAVSVLCPSWVQTRILEAGRNRPAAIQNAAPGGDPEGNAAIRQLVESGMPPEQVAREVFAAIRGERFYILTHPETKAWIRRRMETILATPDA